MGAKFLTSGTVYATAVADFHSSVQAVSISVATVEEVIPPLDAGGIEMTFTINCPYSSAASMGAALVPENLFPVTSRRIDGSWRAAFGPPHAVFATPTKELWSKFVYGG